MKTLSRLLSRNGFWIRNHTHHRLFYLTIVCKSTLLDRNGTKHLHFRLNQNDVVKNLKDLQKHNGKNMIKEAFSIYQNLDETQTNKFVINALLDCCKKVSKQKNDLETMKVIDYIKPSIINDDDNVYGKNTLITIYSQCKDIKNAIKIFDSIPEKKRNIYSLGAMMTAYNNNQQYDNTIALYQQYNNSHNDISNMLFIKACINNGDYDKCRKLIDATMRNNDINNHNIEFITTLMDFYGKTGDTKNALNVFNNLSENKTNIVTINCMMTAFNNNREYYKSISFYEQYIDDKDYNDDISNALFMKACINTGHYEKARKIVNSNITKQDINSHSIEYINTLIDLYGKSGDIDAALYVFNRIPSYKKDVVSVNAMMTSFNHNKDYNQTIFLHEQYNAITKDNEISNLLFIKACSNNGDYDKGKELIESKLKNVNINNHGIEYITTLIDFYGKSGHITNALNIFNSFSGNKKSIISVGAMMNAYNNNKEYDKSILLYQEFDGKHNDVSNMLFIKACINNNDYDKGINLINSIIKEETNINSHSIELITTLIDFHGKIGDINNALKIFDDLSENKRNFVSINSMINAFNHNEQYDKAIHLYEKHRMLLMNDDTSNMLFIKACINSDKYDKGKEIIDSIINDKHINSHNIELITASIIFLCKSGDINNASNVFHRIAPNKISIISIDTMMNAYNNNEQYDKTILLYEQFNNGQYGKYEYDDISNTLFIKACTNIGHYHKVKKLIDAIKTNDDINNRDTEFINTLIVFYGKFGDIDNALNIFNNMPSNKKNMSSIGAMMNAFNNNEQYDETINLFNNIKTDNNIIMNDYIYSLTLIAAGNLVSAYQGSLIIDDLKVNNPNILQSLHVQSAIISLYAKCNKFQKAKNIFNENIQKCKDKNGVLYLYSAMMDCYAKKGDADNLLSLLNNLKTDKTINRITKSIYNIVLNGCSHSGFIDKALIIFDEMKSEYEYNENNIDIQSITPLIDGLGRTGNEYYLNKAEELYKLYILNNVYIDYKLKLPALYSLLSSCRIHNDIIRGKRIFDMIMSIDSNDENAYIMLSNIYGQNGEFDKVDQIREIIGKTRPKQSI